MFFNTKIKTKYDVSLTHVLITTATKQIFLSTISSGNDAKEYKKHR